MQHRKRIPFYCTKEEHEDPNSAFWSLCLEKYLNGEIMLFVNLLLKFIMIMKDIKRKEKLYLYQEIQFLKDQFYQNYLILL